MFATAISNANHQAVQQAFQVIATLHLTAFLWPAQAPVEDGDTYDFIVVGAGTAGCVVTARLVEAGYKVLLIEAGGDPPLESMLPSLVGYQTKTKLDWNYTTTDSGQCHKEHRIDLYSGKMISGSNGLNYLIHARGNPHDFQLWVDASNDTMWSYDEVLTFFKKSEDMRDPVISPNRIDHRTNGLLKLTMRNKNLALDHNIELPSLVNYVAKTKLDCDYTTTDSEQCYKDQRIDPRNDKIISGSNCENDLLKNPQAFKNSDDMRVTEIVKSLNRFYHGTNGPLKITRRNAIAALDNYFDAFAEAGKNVIIDYNGYDTLGYSDVFFTQDNYVRQTTAYAYISPMKENPNLHMLKNTLVTKVIFDELKNAVAVECTTEDNKTITIKARKEIILSAGVFNSPKLLMLSGIGPKDHLQSMDVEVIADLPVGMNLQDHPTTFLMYQMEESDAPSPPPRDPFHTTSDSFFMGYAAVNKSQSYPDYQTFNLVNHHDSTDALQSCASFGMQDNICQQFHDAGKGRTTMFTLLSLMNAKSRGKVSLKSKNPKDKPLVNLNYFSDLSDVERLVDSIEDFTRVSNTTYFRNANASLLAVDLPGCRGIEFGSRDYWRCYVQCAVSTSCHYAGTCPMGAVLDSRMRVHNVNRLRVADASAMPEVTSGNTNAPTIMIGEKAAAMIIEDSK